MILIAPGVRSLLCTVTALLLLPVITACAAVQAIIPAAVASQTPTPAAAPGAAVIPPPPPPVPATPLKKFADVIKDAKATPGYFTLYQHEEKIWIEITPEQLEREFFFALSYTHGVGERGIYGGRMGGSHIVYFHKISNQMQLLARNYEFRAQPNLPVARAVREGFSDSLLASAIVVSQPHPERKSVLVEVNSLLLTDLPGAATQLEAAFRLPYAMDVRNSSFTRVTSQEQQTTFQVSAHYVIAKLPPPPLVPSSAPTVPPPLNLPDPRSLFLGIHYSFSPLPAPMTPRLADERVGHFTTSFLDYSDDLNPETRVHYVRRWRLEKQDPSAELSEPKQPIVFWLDRNIPAKYQQAVIDGILEWNKAFEKIGFKDAVRAELQPADADFDTADTKHASIRWYLGSDVGSAVGPSQADPRTGEILDADIRMSDVFGRSSRRVIVEEVPRPQAFGADAAEFCSYGSQMIEEMDFALDILEARGDLSPDSPEAAKFVQDYVKEVIIHEVGHTLGLRHNFRSSTIYSDEQLRDKEFTGKNGLTGSIMDYTPFNLATKAERQGQYAMTTIGPYDYWAIEYAYKPMAPEKEKEELAKIAGRNTEPLLAYGTDEDTFLGGAPQGMDPEVNQFDLGRDPLAFYKKRLQLSRELWDRLQTKQLQSGESYQVLRRNLESGFRNLGRALVPATKYIGGVVQVRDRAGTNREPYTPVPPARQREALTLLADGMFSADSFRFKPEFMSRLTYNRLDYFDNLVRGNVNTNPDFSLSAQLLAMQRTVLNQVMSDAVAARLLDSELRVADGKQAFHLSELYDTLTNAIWSELRTGKDIGPLRRNLQREHLARVAGVIVRPSASTPADVRSLQRENARDLLARIKSAQSKPGFSKEARAHLAESANSLEEALKAPLQRAGV